MRFRAFVGSGPTRVYRLRYENPGFLRENGRPHFREITVPVGSGRFKLGKEADALELAERRLSESYGRAALEREARVREGSESAGPIPGYLDPAAETLRRIPDAHQDGYELVSVERVK